MQANKVLLAMLLAVCAGPVLAQGVPTSFQGKWVSNATATAPKAAQLNAMCSGQVHSEDASSLDIDANSLTYNTIGSTTTADNLHFNTRGAARLAGTARVNVMYEDESTEPARQGNFQLSLRSDGSLEGRADWLNGTAVFARCAR